MIWGKVKNTLKECVNECSYMFLSVSPIFVYDDDLQPSDLQKFIKNILFSNFKVVNMQ